MIDSSHTGTFSRRKVKRSAVVRNPPYRRALFVLLIPLSLLLTELAARNPVEIEESFSRGIYPVLSSFFGRIFGLLPISVAEIALYCMIIGVIVWLVMKIYTIVHSQQKRHVILGMLATIGCIGGIAYFLFTIFCGLNYHRVTFADQSGLTIRPSSPQELAALYSELIEDASTARALLTENEDGVMMLGQSSYDIAKKTPEAMALAAEDYPMLDGYAPKPKPVLFSRGMSMIDITGIYIPFTFEANVNVDVEAYNIPFTMMHELAHYKGFMREDEANFIAFLACRKMADPVFQYSGYALSLLHTGNALYSADPGLYREVNAALPDDIRRDFAANSAYWKQFEGPVAVMASAVNDSYLKANRQTEGVQSYGRMVDLLLADYRERHGLE